MGIWGICDQTISANFGAVRPLSIFSIIQPLFLQKTKPNVYLGLGFEFGRQRNCVSVVRDFAQRDLHLLHSKKKIPIIARHRKKIISCNWEGEAELHNYQFDKNCLIWTLKKTPNFNDCSEIFFSNCHIWLLKARED